MRMALGMKQKPKYRCNTLTLVAYRAKHSVTKIDPQVDTFFFHADKIILYNYFL